MDLICSAAEAPEQHGPTLPREEEAGGSRWYDLGFVSKSFHVHSVRLLHNFSIGITSDHLPVEMSLSFPAHTSAPRPPDPRRRPPIPRAWTLTEREAMSFREDLDAFATCLLSANNDIALSAHQMADLAYFAARRFSNRGRVERALPNPAPGEKTRDPLALPAQITPTEA